MLLIQISDEKGSVTAGVKDVVQFQSGISIALPNTYVAISNRPLTFLEASRRCDGIDRVVGSRLIKIWDCGAGGADTYSNHCSSKSKRTDMIDY